MASLRTSLILALVAGSLLVFILWFERGTPSSGELERRKDSALPDFVREHVTKLEIQRRGQLTVLVRSDSEDESEPVWRVEKPFRGPADRDLVDNLLGELEFAETRRSLSDISSADRERFGFERPRFRVWYTQGGTRSRVVIGNESPRGDGLYIEGPSPGRAFIVDKKLAQTLTQEPLAYFSKELITDVRVDRVDELTIGDSHGERVLRRSGEGWQLTKPALGMASAPAVADLVSALDALRSKRFVVPRASAEELSSFGLEKPRARVQLRLRPATQGQGEEAAGSKATPQPSAATERVIVLRIGKPCPKHAGESYANAALDGPVMCVLDSDLDKVLPAVDSLREGRLLALDGDGDEALRSVQLERGDRRLALTRSGSEWTYESSRGGQTQVKGTARASAVGEWLDALRAAKALRWEPAAALQPAGEVTVLRIERKDQPAYELHVHPGPEAARIRRGDEPEVGVFAVGTGELLWPGAARFRSLEVARIAEPTLREIEIRRGGPLERIARDAGSAAFALVEPLNAAVDSARLQELTRFIARLEAIRFAADAPSEDHGLATPVAQLTLGYEASGKDAPRQRLGLRVGAATDGGRFAQLDGQPGVFVLPSSFVELLLEPLVSRTALAVPFERVHDLAISRGVRVVRIERRGDGFAATGENLDGNGAKLRVEALSTLRAIRADHYGEPLPAEGLQRPLARIQVAVEGGAPVTLVFGAAVAQGRYARRSDLPVTFIVPEANVHALLGSL